MLKRVRLADMIVGMVVGLLAASLAHGVYRIGGVGSPELTILLGLCIALTCALATAHTRPAQDSV